jgi:hypothetical protein
VSIFDTYSKATQSIQDKIYDAKIISRFNLESTKKFFPSNKSKKIRLKITSAPKHDVDEFFATQCRNRNKIYDLKTVSGISSAKKIRKISLLQMR